MHIRTEATAMIVAAILLFASMSGVARAETCEKAVQQLNQGLSSKIDEQELVTIIRSLNTDDTLPEKFVTKGQASRMGWRPGKDLWLAVRLKGKSIGGDRFGNREGRLPDGGRKWREADLDYKGGHRGSKRLLYASDGLRMVTVDHYNTFTKVPACH